MPDVKLTGIIIKKHISMDSFSKSTNLFSVVIKWKWVLFSVFIISIVLSSIFSGEQFIKPKYRSTAILYPSNLIPYSSETPTEQMLQIFKSEDLRDLIIQKFNLQKHYRIDSTQKHYKSKLNKEFESNVSIKKNEFEAVVIDVLDENPQIACDMVNAMVIFFNKKARELQREKTSEVVVIWENQLKNKQIQIDSIEKKFAELRIQYGLLDFQIQTKEASRQFFRQGFIKDNNIFQNLKEKGGELQLLSEQLESATKDLSKIRSEYDIAISDLNKELTYTNIVSSPSPADKKAYPIRWFIVLISAVSSMLFTIMIIAFVEKVKHDSFLRKQNIQQNNI